MVRLVRSLLIVSLLSCAGWAALQATPNNPQVIVSVYDQAGVPSNVLSRAERDTGRLLGQASVSVTWVNCPSGPSGVSAWGEKTAARQLMVRIVPRALTLSDIAYGAAFLGSDGRGEYADIFFDSVQRLRDEETQVSQALILGYVMAHELGHLLLGSNAHSSLGVMRPHWSRTELQSISMGRLSFTADQRREIHQRLEAEAQSALTSANVGPGVTVTSWLHQHHPESLHLP